MIILPESWRKHLSKLHRAWTAFGSAEGGSVVMIGAAAILVLFCATSATLNYSRAVLARSKLRSAVDQAVLAAAPQLGLAGSSDQAIVQSATAMIRSLIGPAPTGSAPDEISVAIVNNRTAVQATATRSLLAVPGDFLNKKVIPVKVQAAAEYMNRRPPLCALTLDPSGGQAFQLSQTGSIQAPNCTVYSNSTSTSGMTALSTSLVKSAYACSSGGYSGSSANFNPVPQTSCPVLPDPLRSRAAPAIGSCTSQTTNVTIAGGSQTLQPGTYCGGITIKKGASVTFAAGEYILNGGQLWVTGGSSITGNGVGFYFTNGASVAFDAASTVSLVAPSSGPLISLLFFQDPSAAAGKDTFDISSDNASRLEGTLYLPKGRLWIGANKSVAQTSAYTILIAYQLAVSAGPVIYLNTNYSASTVPVPPGIINNTTSKASTRLIQ